MTLHRPSIAVLLFAALVASPLAAVCAGWSASAYARMACCAGSGHDDGHRDAAVERCCAAGGGSRTMDTPAPGPVALPGQAARRGSATVVVQSPVMSRRAADHLRAAPSHLVLSVLLI